MLTSFFCAIAHLCRWQARLQRELRELKIDASGAARDGGLLLGRALSGPYDAATPRKRARRFSAVDALSSDMQSPLGTAR